MSSLRNALWLFLLAGCNGQLRFESAQNAGPPDAQVSACTKDDDCALASLHCDAVSGACVACNGDQDCDDPDAPRCDTALHRCVGCGNDLDCGAGRTCVPMTRTCATRCEEGPTEDSCPASAPTCDEVARICVQCQSDQDCRAITDDGDYCVRASGRCVRCTDERQCPATSPRCDPVQHRCGECSTSHDCPNGQACDPDGLTCM